MLVVDLVDVSEVALYCHILGRRVIALVDRVLLIVDRAHVFGGRRRGRGSHTAPGQEGILLLGRIGLEKVVRLDFRDHEGGEIALSFLGNIVAEFLLNFQIFVEFAFFLYFKHLAGVFQVVFERPFSQHFSRYVALVITLFVKLVGSVGLSRILVEVERVLKLEPDQTKVRLLDHSRRLCTSCAWR